jgi:hypothetical protein
VGGAGGGGRGAGLPAGALSSLSQQRPLCFRRRNKLFKRRRNAALDLRYTGEQLVLGDSSIFLKQLDLKMKIKWEILNKKYNTLKLTVSRDFQANVFS